jgi:hypothetical protein
MWFPPSTWIYAAASGANAARTLNKITAEARGQTTKVVCCESCRQHYAYELTRTGHGAVDGTSGNAYSTALLRAEADLQHLLATEIEAIPCPACGWYQSDMVPIARKLHRRWMVHVGLCLTLGLIPVALIGLLINTENGKHPVVESVANGTSPPIPWPIFVAGLVCCLAGGIGMFIGRRLLAKKFNPNDEDVEARKRYGQSRAILLSEQEANDLLAHGRLPDLFPSRRLGAERSQIAAQGAPVTQAQGTMIGTPPESKLSSCRWTSICVGVALIAGVYYWHEWNDWKEKTKREVDAEIMRREYRIQQMQMEHAKENLSDPNWPLRRFQEENARIQQALEQEALRRQNPSPPNFRP